MQAGSEHQSSFAKLQEYEQLSLAHKFDDPSKLDRANNWAGVVFRLGDHKLACSIADISEILTLENYSPVPGAKPWILGLANVRGNLVTICDLLWSLTGIRSPLTSRTRTLIAPMQGRPVGLLVDEVYGQRHFHTDDAKKTRVFEKTELAGFVKLQYKTKDEAWGVLDMDALLNDSKFLSGAN